MVLLYIGKNIGDNMKNVLHKSKNWTLLINEHNVMILIYQHVGGISRRPYIDDRWDMIASRTGDKTPPKTIMRLVEANIKNTKNYRRRA